MKTTNKNLESQNFLWIEFTFVVLWENIFHARSVNKWHLLMVLENIFQIKGMSREECLVI